MANLYYKKIKCGAIYKGHVMTIDDVPKRWRDEVQAMLDADIE